MGISRLFYGKSGDKLNLQNFMIFSGLLCIICYVLASLFENPVLGLIGCILCGFSVGIMWPGTISIFSKLLPLGGTAMFAGCLFPVVLVICTIFLKIKKSDKK